MSIEALAHDLRGAAVGMADVPVRGVQRIEVVLPAPIRLSEFTKARREARRPVAYRSPDFAAQFDDDTLFYDAFRSSDGRIVLCQFEKLIGDSPDVTSTDARDQAFFEDGTVD